MSAYEVFQSYRKGWRDGACARPQDPKFIQHKTRPDLKDQYLRGHYDGYVAYKLAMNAEMDRTGYKPSILREEANARS